jgi:hypothetical protein
MQAGTSSMVKAWCAATCGAETAWVYVFDAPTAFESHSRTLQIRWCSDSTVDQLGVALTWEFMNWAGTPYIPSMIRRWQCDAGDGQFSSPCVLSNAAVQAFAPNGDQGYGTNQQLYWRVQAPAGQQVRLTITQVNLEFSQSCVYDHLRISGINTAGSQQSTWNELTYCGSYAHVQGVRVFDSMMYEQTGWDGLRPTVFVPVVVLSESGFLDIQFKTDGSVSGAGFSQAFIATYDFVDPATLTWTWPLGAPVALNESPMALADFARTDTTCLLLQCAPSVNACEQDPVCAPGIDAIARGAQASSSSVSTTAWLSLVSCAIFSSCSATSGAGAAAEWCPSLVGECPIDYIKRHRFAGIRCAAAVCERDECCVPKPEREWCPSLGATFCSRNAAGLVVNVLENISEFDNTQCAGDTCTRDECCQRSALQWCSSLPVNLCYGVGLVPRDKQVVCAGSHCLYPECCTAAADPTDADADAAADTDAGGATSCVCGETCVITTGNGGVCQNDNVTCAVNIVAPSCDVQKACVCGEACTMNSGGTGTCQSDNLTCVVNVVAPSCSSDRGVSCACGDACVMASGSAGVCQTDELTCAVNIVAPNCSGTDNDTPVMTGGTAGTGSTDATSVTGSAGGTGTGAGIDGTEGVFDSIESCVQSCQNAGAIGANNQVQCTIDCATTLLSAAPVVTPRHFVVVAMTVVAVVATLF